MAGAPPRVERPATAPAEPGAVASAVQTTPAHLAKWLAENRGALEADIRIRDRDRVTPDIRDALRLFRPLALALLVTDVINADGDSWSSFRREVDTLEASGLTRADAIRRAYARRFRLDPGDIDPAGLGWLWSGV